MDKPAKEAVRELTLKLRKVLETEIERELGRYGIFAGRAWIDANDAPRLSAEERDRDRPRIEAAIQREREAGLDQAGAVRAYIRETAYTHMNRLLGLKCMESRGLINESITTRPIYSDRSQRHRDYLDEHPESHRQPGRGLVAMLRQAYAEVSQHIGVVFDPDSEQNVVWPRPTVLKEIIEWINALDALEVQGDGSGTENALPQSAVDQRHLRSRKRVYTDDTVLGWVYQYYQEEDKKRVFSEVSKKRKKISGYDIIPATTIYTERYMVQFLVENSLGAVWMEMYPASDLCRSWPFFVEDSNLQNEDGTRGQAREPRPVSELTLLDPACGSGHFLLYAFDLFGQMYEVEAEMEGRPPDRAEIARQMLRHNLYGIDIDLRSVQIAALNLYMKACTYAGVRLDELQDGGSVHMNLVCADIVLRPGPEFKELLERFESDPLTQELIKTIWRGLENARELGSLLKVVEQVDAVIARKRAGEKGSFWEHPDEAWDLWKRDMLDTLKEYVERAADSFDINRRMFGQEAIKGVQLLDLLTRRFDLVMTNPPYMGAGSMGPSLKEYVWNNYPAGRSDLYAAFIERLLGFVCQDGYLAMITQQTFMFIKSFECLRRHIIRSSRIRSVAHLGPHAFQDIGGEKVNTVMFVLCSQGPGAETLGVYLRAVDRTDKASFLLRLCQVDRPRDEVQVSDRYLVAQSELKEIPGWPINYWVGRSLRKPFQVFTSLASHALTAVGLSTANNERFIRFWWEIGFDHLDRGWKEHLHGGETVKWYGNLDHVIYWAEDGQSVKQNPGATIRNEGLYFSEGLTWSDVGTTGFSARYQPHGRIWDTSVNTLVPKRLEWGYFLGLLNTRLINLYLDLLNPTFHYLVGDVSRLPLATPEEHQVQVIDILARQCVAEQRGLYHLSPTSREFTSSALHQAATTSGEFTLVSLFSQAQSRADEKQLRIAVNEASIEREVHAVYNISDADSGRVFEFQSLPSAFLPILAGHEAPPDGLLPAALEYLAALPRVQTTPHDLANVKQKMTQLHVREGKSLEEISAELELNPISVISLRRELGLISPADFRHEVENLLTHRIWELCKRDEDGIIPYDAGLGNPSLLEQVRGEIESVFGADRAVDIESEMDEILGRGGLAGWLGAPFFKKHVSQFKKRPILWQITSPERKFRALVYCHKLDHDTLPKVRSQYLWPLLERARTRLRAIQKQNPFDLKAIGELEEYVADLEVCDQRLENVIQDHVDVELPDWANGPYRNGKAPYHPDIDDGVKVNILPLQAAGLLPMKVI